MVAFHSFWSEPNRCRNGGEVLFPDFEQLTAILSALEWQRHNGPIRMVTDTAGLEFFEKSGLRGFWNQMVPELDALQGKIDPIAFWAAGKLYALQTMTLPCVMLDTDLIIWENLDERLEADVVAAHPEPLNPGTYPDPSGFRFRDDYVFPKTWNTALPAANTAFLFIRDPAFRDFYVSEAYRFMKYLRVENLDPVQSMCFAEQRLLPMCVEEAGRTLSYLMLPEQISQQQFITHTWGYKQLFRANRDARKFFCARCVRRIISDFPEEAKKLNDCRDLKQYYVEETQIIPEEKERGIQ